MNYNTVLDHLEKHRLLNEAWQGVLFDELPEDMQKHVEDFVRAMRKEIIEESHEAESKT